ncbi:ABC transporter ATP-binding protein [Deinococcus lacus]|uniref:ABC transporter ATP-binding protein n=1 Tax=Deinococcus lacus TaxID=392561 RepID=A0ABW1YF76_9DEIO
MTTALHGVSKTFGPVAALCDLTLELRPGELTALLGPNGAGKTTALSLLLGLAAPTSGRVEVLGGDPRRPEIRARIGSMPQESAIPTGLTVREAVTLFASFYPAPLSVDRALALADLGSVAGRRAGQLSGGQKRRLAFALAVVGNPDLLLIDEPTTGMDAASRAAFWQAVGALKAQGRTILLTTHYLEEAEKVADRVLILSGGRMLAGGTPDHLRAGVRGARVSFCSGLSLAQLRGLPGVTDAALENGRAELHTDTPEDLLAALVRSGTAFDELEVTRATLEEAYLRLTSAV